MNVPATPAPHAAVLRTKGECRKPGSASGPAAPARCDPWQALPPSSSGAGRRLRAPAAPAPHGASLAALGARPLRKARGFVLLDSFLGRRAAAPAPALRKGLSPQPRLSPPQGFGT